MRSRCFAGWLLLIAVLFSSLACSSASPPPALDVVWADGEESHYDVMWGGSLTGTETYWMERTEDGWRQRYESNRRGRVEKGEVRFDAALRPISSFREVGGERIEVSYRQGSATVKVPSPVGGAPIEKTVETPLATLDNEASLMALRGLALPEGASASFTDVVPRTSSAAKLTVTSAGRRTVDTPLGPTEVSCLWLSSGLTRQEACYSTAAPRVLVRHESPSGGTSLVLRSFRASAGAPLRGDASAAAVPPGPAPVSALRIALAALVALPLMLVLPLLLGRYYKRRFGVGWKLWGAGALTFVASQVVHLPLNWAVGLIGSLRGLSLLPLPWLAVAAGLSAGLCEEIARFIAWRFALRKAARSFPEALQFGAGHGGIEAMIIGALFAVQVGAMVLLSLVPLSKLGLSGSTASLVEAQRDAFWLAPWYGPVLAGTERIFAILLHTACTVLVVRGVARRQPAWVLLAVLLHAGVDAWAVWAHGTFGVAATEAGVGVMGLGCLAILWAAGRTADIRSTVRSGE